MSDIPEVQNGPDWVVMHHPDIDGYAEVTQEAYDAVYEAKGWRVVTDRDRSAQFAGLKKSELVAEANRLGVDPSGTADDIRSRLATANKES